MVAMPSTKPAFENKDAGAYDGDRSSGCNQFVLASVRLVEGLVLRQMLVSIAAVVRLPFHETNAPLNGEDLPEQYPVEGRFENYTYV